MIKKAAFLFFLNVLFIACSSNQEEIIVTNLNVEVEIPGEWKLIKMTGSFEGSQTTGDDMYWQENYLFYNDGTFVKTRFFNGETYQFQGAYEVEEAQTNESFDYYVTLSYPEQNDIIASCNYNSTYEHLMLVGSTLVSSYNACDGPGLFYEKVHK